MHSTNIRMTEETYEIIRKICFDKRISINQFVNEAIKEKIERDEKR